MRRREHLVVVPYGFVLLICALVWGVAPRSAHSQTMPTPAATQTQDRDDNVTRRQLASFDNFLDSHPQVAEDLRKDPSQVNNEEFVEKHPALQEYLQQHPEVREELSQNPNRFMHREERFDRREDQGRDRDVTRSELANMDRFMDGHPEIAEQLRKDPSLVNDKKFVGNHPALQQFLADHPGVREEYKENPNAFMHQEQRFDQRQDSGMRSDRDLNRGEVASFNEFLEDHNKIAGELSKNPSLANNKDYLQDHPALQDYLKAHPQVHEELSENPQTFLRSTQQFSTHSTSTAKVGESKPK